MATDLAGATITSAQIVPIAVTLDGHVGLTLWASPWRSADGHAAGAFLRVQGALMLFPDAGAMQQFIAAGTPNDLEDHPGWAAVTGMDVSHLQAAPDFMFDLDAAEAAPGIPTPEVVRPPVHRVSKVFGRRSRPVRAATSGRRGRHTVGRPVGVGDLVR
jgi:hypothetical protein